MSATCSARYGAIDLGRLIGEIVRRLMGAMVADVLAETRTRLEAAAPESAAAVRGHRGPTAGFTTSMEAGIVALKSWLFAHMYRHPRVIQPMGRAKEVVAALFSALSGDPALMPPDWAVLCGGPKDAATVSAVRDYIAGMTDTYALTEYARVFHTQIAL